MNFNKALWGILLIVLGLLFVFENLSIIDFHWYNIMQLWPVLLVFWGISLLPVKSGWKALFSFIVLIGAVSFALQDDSKGRIWRFDWDYEDDKQEQVDKDWQENKNWKFQKEQIPFDTLCTHAELKFDGAAGEFVIKDTTSKYLMDFEKKGNVGNYTIRANSMDSLFMIDVNLNNKTIKGRNKFNEANIKLNPLPVWEIKLDLGAADVNMDLSDFKVKKIDIDGGASNVHLKMGKQYSDAEVIVEAGATRVDIQIPEDVGGEVRCKTVLSGKDLEGFVKESRSHYYTPGFESRKKQITIQVNAAVSSLKVERY